MNDLYLIGNGFDLAHGLKTSYNDFLLWYLKDSLSKVDHNVHFEDALIKIDRKDRMDFSSFNSISVLLKNAESISTVITYEHDFFKNIVVNYLDYKWVDIEYEYYLALVGLYQKLKVKGVSRSDQVDKELDELNKCFKVVKEKLIEYLSTIKITPDLRNKEVQQILGINDKEILGKKLFVCFNYTHTIDKLYLENTFFKNDINYIHGELSDNSNPIIFGYGDEMAPDYENIKELSNNGFLSNMKPICSVTDNSQRIMNFLDSGNFIVNVLGHSCGRSDRYLLNPIFEHVNCKSIRIYHYETTSDEQNDYLNKKQEISRHLKNEYNMKIAPFDKYSTMPQNPKEN